MEFDPGPSLVEAAPYIAMFRDQIVVIELGSKLLDRPPELDRILPQIAVLCRAGLKPLVVHGGGKQVDEACEARGLMPRKIHGRRITSPDVMAVVLDEVGGRINRTIVRGLRAQEVPARGYSDGLSGAVRCGRRPPSTVDGKKVDWGEVGDVAAVQTGLLLGDEQGPWSVPVLPSLGSLPDGSPVNVNADTVSSRVASSLRARKLVFVTSVAGVMAEHDATAPISELTHSRARALFDQGIVSGGMQSKIEEGLKALQGGVSRVHVISGMEPSTLLREIFTEEGCGTSIVGEGE